MATLIEITELALKAGAIVSESGGETYRVEETMRRMSLALGAETADPYATQTGIFLSCQASTPDSDNTKVITRMRRIRSKGTNLGKIAAINTLSRSISSSSENINIDYTKNELHRIDTIPDYKPISTVLVTAFTAFIFALMFSGSVKDGLIAFFISTIMRSILYFISRFKPSGFMFSIMGSSVISFFTGFLTKIGISMNFGIVNISILMALVPGMAIVVAIRDMIAGDYISGRARATEAFFIALGLSVGASVGLLIFPSAKDYNLSMAMFRNPYLSFLYGGFVSSGFAYIFQVIRLNNIFLSGIAGALSWMFYIIMLNYNIPVMTSFIIGAFCAGIISEIFAFIFKEPATVFVIPALIAFVPGGGMYAIMYNIVLGKSSMAITYLLSTLSIAASIALGVAFASGFARFTINIIKRSKTKQK